ncbi:MAG: hypothetical protein JWM11_77 [Planctomycetaceae bacterium]|nr:hypothetical protein [Planctomycetaceae bacterium]
MSDTATADNDQSPVPPPLLHVNLFYRLAAGLVVLFVITVFAMIANLLGNPKAPIAKFLDQYALHLIACETIGILIAGALAMTVDRWQALRDAEHIGANQPSAEPENLPEENPE